MVACPGSARACRVVFSRKVRGNCGCCEAVPGRSRVPGDFPQVIWLFHRGYAILRRIAHARKVSR
jgi:hypothetical protein